MRTALWEAQAQSTAEACRQKWYYDRKIGAINLKPGNLVLVKADAWKGKRKIKDRWKKRLGRWCFKLQLMSPLTSEEPMQKVTSPPLKPTSFHCIRDWHSLVYGSHHTWDKCISPTPHKTTSVRGGKKRMPQEESGKAVTQ